MTVEHLHILFDNTRDSKLFFRACEQMAQANPTIAAMRVGRMTALRKFDGGVRGIVAGTWFVDLSPARWPSIHQGEGGEQGDALMPLLFALGQHSALDAIQENLEDGEHLFAFHATSTLQVPQTEWDLCMLFSRNTCTVTPRIRINGGKTQGLNQAGVMHATFWSASRRNHIQSKHGCGEAQVCLKRSKG